MQRGCLIRTTKHERGTFFLHFFLCRHVLPKVIMLEISIVAHGSFPLRVNTMEEDGSTIFRNLFLHATNLITSNWLFSKTKKNQSSLTEEPNTQQQACMLQRLTGSRNCSISCQSSSNMQVGYLHFMLLFLTLTS